MPQLLFFLLPFSKKHQSCYLSKLINLYNVLDLWQNLHTVDNYMSMGYCPSVRAGCLDIGQVLFLACLWIETELKSIDLQNKHEANSQPSWPKKLGQSIKHLVHVVGQKSSIFLLVTAVNPERSRKHHLARLRSQSQLRIQFITLHGASQIIKTNHR